MDVAGPLEVFSLANRIAGSLWRGDSEPYDVEIISAQRERRLESSSGMTLLANRDLRDCRGHIDTLLISGTAAIDAKIGDAVLLDWVRRIAPGVRRLGSVGTGTFVLAAAGLLDGRSATTHWEYCPRLTREYPAVLVCPDRIFVQDGNTYTSAGLTAGIDLALAFVEQDLGRDVATRVAQQLLLFVRRPSGHSQLSTVLEAQAATRNPIGDLLVWAAEHPKEDLSVERLAARVNMSCRNFARAFRRAVGKTPARYIEGLRVETARRMLEQTEAQMEEIAATCGLGSGNSMRRSFVRVLGVPPTEYRDRVRVPKEFSSGAALN